MSPWSPASCVPPPSACSVSSPLTDGFASASSLLSFRSFTARQTSLWSCAAAGTSALEAAARFWMFPLQTYLRLVPRSRSVFVAGSLCMLRRLCTFVSAGVLCAQCVSGHRAEEAVEMLKTFYKQENPNGDQHLFSSPPVSFIFSASIFFSPYGHVFSPSTLKFISALFI